MAGEIPAGGITVPLTHPDKILFPAEGITKADLARYYADVARDPAGAGFSWDSYWALSIVRSRGLVASTQARFCGPRNPTTSRMITTMNV